MHLFLKTIWICFILIGTSQVFASYQSPPKIVFKSDSLEITEGQKITLSWNCSDADKVTIEPTIGEVTTESYIKVLPKKTTEYVITASNAFGVTKKSLKIKVVAEAKFESSPTIIGSSKFELFKWRVKGAETIRISPQIGQVKSKGMKLVKYPLATSYQLQATTESGDSVIRTLTFDKPKMEEVLSTSLNLLGDYNRKSRKAIEDIINEGSPALKFLKVELDAILLEENNLLKILEEKGSLSKQQQLLNIYTLKQIQLLDIFVRIGDPAATPLIIRIAKNSGSDSYIQFNVFIALSEFSDDKFATDYVYSVLDDNKSSPVQRRAGLYFFGDGSQNSDKAIAYAKKFIQPEYDIIVREVAVFIAASQKVSGIKSVIISILNKDAEARWKNNALHALALVSTPEEFTKAIEGIELEQDATNASENLVNLNNSSGLEKARVVGKIILSKSSVGRRQALHFIFLNNRIDLLERYYQIPTLSERQYLDMAIQSGLFLEPEPLLNILFREEDRLLIESFMGGVRGSAETPVLFTNNTVYKIKD